MPHHDIAFIRDYQAIPSNFPENFYYSLVLCLPLYVYHCRVLPAFASSQSQNISCFSAYLVFYLVLYTISGRFREELCLPASRLHFVLFLYGPLSSPFLLCMLRCSKEKRRNNRAGCKQQSERQALRSVSREPPTRKDHKGKRNPR